MVRRHVRLIGRRANAGFQVVERGGTVERAEFDAGDGQLIVVYAPGDYGSEIDPMALYAEIARDAADLALHRGLHMVSMTSMPLRHSGAMMSRQGSGYETKAVVAVAYAPESAAG
jgi:hypothetical protein